MNNYDKMMNENYNHLTEGEKEMDFKYLIMREIKHAPFINASDKVKICACMMCDFDVGHILANVKNTTKSEINRLHKLYMCVVLRFSRKLLTENYKG